jgi:hypothetical protein
MADGPPGKGLGLIALRAIPEMSRVIVDRMYSFEEAAEDPRLADLVPKAGSVDQKFELNAFQTFGSREIVAFRMARLNHSCEPNVWCW